MRRCVAILLVGLAALLPSSGQEKKKGVKKEEPSPAANATHARWYGHGFVYLTSSSGVRVAIDPYNEGPVQYKFPERLHADVVLISNESDDSSAGERLFGTPQVFRSITAIGINRANGVLFKGVQTFRDSRRGAQSGSNTTYVFTLDGVVFAYMGAIGHGLDSKQRQEIGQVDVLFLPIGSRNASVPDLKNIVRDTGAKIVVPIKYNTMKTGALDLRELDDFLEGLGPVEKIDGAEFEIRPSLLPKETTYYILKSP
jgi:L-ascorbate metabolism protein UlaG (beta-lactamase superfamily)